MMPKTTPIRALFAYLYIVAFAFCAWQRDPSPEPSQYVRAEFITMLAISLLVSAATTVLAELIRPKQKFENAKPAGRGEFSFPTAVEDRGVPIIFGRVKVAGPNVVWWGDLRQIPVKEKIKTGLWSSQRVITGYNYYVGMDMAICRGGATAVTLQKVFVGDRQLVGAETGVIDQPTFLGGDDFGSGGIVGTGEFFGGTTTQSASTYLSGFQSPISGQRGTSHYVFEGGYIGNSTSIEPWGFEVRRLGATLFAAADAAGLAGSYSAADAIVNTDDMNPMEVLYESIADIDWGMGRPNLVDLENFAAVADVLKSEGNGFAMQVERNIPISELQLLVQQQIDGVLDFDKFTGKFTVKLARGDYTTSLAVTSITGTDTYNVASGGLGFEVGQVIYAGGFDNAANNGRKTVAAVTATTIQVDQTLVNETPSGAIYGGPRVSELAGLDERTKVRVSAFSRQTWSGTTNQVRAKFTDRSRDYFDTFARADSLANQRMQQGEIVVANPSYPGVKNATLASAIAARELRLLSYPLIQLKVETNRELFGVRIGDVVRWTDEDLGFLDLPMRVTRVDFGTIGATMSFDMVQDIFSLETGFFGDAPASKWAYPTQDADPIPTAQSVVIEAPKAIIDRDELYPDRVNRVWVGGRRQSAEVTIPIWQRNDPTTPSGDFAEDGEVWGMLLIGRLDTVMSASDAQPTASVTVEAHLSTVAEIQAAFSDGDATADQLGQDLKYLIRVNDEFMLVTGIGTVTSTTVELTGVYRGAMDSVPGEHAVDDLVFFLFVAMGLNDTDFPAGGHVVDVELLARSRDDQVTLVEADTIQVTLDDRTLKPYPPVELELNATRFDDPVSFDTQRPSTSGIDNRGIDCFFDRRDFRTVDEVASLLDDAENLDSSFPAANSTEHRIVVIDDPAGSPTTVLTGAWTGSTRNLFASRTDILAGMSTPGTIPTTLQVQVQARHTVDSVQHEGRVALSWSFSLDTSELDNDTNLGALSDSTTSSGYTAPDTDTYDVTIGTALAGDLQVQINGGGFSTVIAASGTSGTFAASSGDTITFQHLDGGTPQTLMLVESQGASTVGAYAILVD